MLFKLLKYLINYNLNLKQQLQRRQSMLLNNTHHTLRRKFATISKTKARYSCKPFMNFLDPNEKGFMEKHIVSKGLLVY